MVSEETATGKNELLFVKFERMVEKLPDKPGIIYLGEKFSYVRETTSITNG